MSQSTPSADLTTDNKPPTPPPAPATPGAQTVQAAPAAVKRSMPMALSILLGILLASILGWFFQTLMWFILLLYLCFVAATVLDAPVGWLIRHGIRRVFAAAIVMVGGMAALLGTLWFVATGIYSQGVALSAQLEKAPGRLNQFVNGLGHRFPGVGDRLKDFDVGKMLADSMPNFPKVLEQTMVGFEIVSALVVSFFIVLYMLIDGPSHLKAARCLLPRPSRLEATRVFNDVGKAHRGWAEASALNVTSSTILTAGGLWLLHVPGALILGFFAGLGELIPNVGPFFGALPALIFALIIDPQLFLYVALMFVVVQTVQSYTITPQVLKFSIELPILVTIISVLVMGILFGILGVLVAIPLVTDMVVMWNYIAAMREKDTTDYDCVNPPTNGTRQAADPDNTHPSRLKKIFRRDLRRANPGDGAAAAGAGSLDGLEKAEQRAAVGDGKSEK